MLLVRGKVRDEDVNVKETRGEYLFGVYVMSKVGGSGGAGDDAGHGVAMLYETITTTTTLNMLRHALEQNAHYRRN